MDALGTLSGSVAERSPASSRASVQNYGVHLFLISVACVYYLSNADLLLGHYDLGWHLAAGDLIRQRGDIPFQDPWSFTLADRQWYNLSWLWDVMASVLYQYAGFGGLVLSVVGCGGLIVGYLTSLCLSRGASVVAVGAAVFFGCVLYPSFVTPPNIYLAASPNTATMLFAVVFYGECLRRTRLLLLPPLMVLWVNLHGGFPLGFAIVGLFGGIALLKRDWAGFRIYSLAAGGCAAAVFVNPLGWHIYDGVSATLGHFVQANITEWMSYYDNMTLPGCIPGIVYVVLFIALELSDPKGRRIPVESRLLSWLFLGLGLYQFRYLSFFFLFSTVPLALHIDRWLPKQLLNDDFEIRKALLAAGLIGACALPVTFMHMRSAFALPQMLSQADADYLTAHFSHTRLLNHWNTGGLLIFRTEGKVPVFVDGRAATAYPDDLLHDYFSLVEREIDEAAWDRVIAKYRIDTILWVKAYQPLRDFLVGKRGWKEQYSGEYESVYVRP
jgi:hypothetical protein